MADTKLSEDDRFEQLLQTLHDGVYFVDKEKTIMYWNKSAEVISGYSSGEVRGRCCSDNLLRHIDDEGNELCLRGCPLSATLDDGKQREARVYLHHKEGQRVPVAVKIAPVRDSKGEITGAIEIFRDTSTLDHTKSEIEKLKKQVYTDALTGVGNRKYLDLLLNKHLAEQRSIQMQFGLIFLDIDHFKQFNDTYGHLVGDAVLTLVAKTVAGVLRDFDVVCRMGGEEFVAIIPNTNSKIVAEIAERARMFVEKTWLEHEGQELKVTISVGATMSRLDDDPQSILARADELMYSSKKGGRNRVSLGI